MKKRLALLLIFTMVVSMFLVGCTTKAPVATPDPTEDVLANNPAADKGNILTIGGTNLNGVLNPINYTTVYDHWMIGAMFDPLLYTKTDGELVTDGAVLEKYTVSPDGLVFNFTLRPGVKWHDGVEMTAEDIAFTYDAIMRPDYKGRLFNLVRDIEGALDRKEGKADSVSGIKVISKYEVQITMTVAKATNLRNLTGDFYAIPKHYYDKPTVTEIEALDRQPLGNGPFKLKNYVVEQFLEMEPFAEYWQGAPKLDGIIYKMVARPNELSEFEIGSIDAVNFENSKENYEIIEGFGHANLINNWNNGYAYVGFNFNIPMFQDKLVRQALVYGLDRAGFVQSFFGDLGGKVAHTPISPVSWAYPEGGLNEYKYDPVKANQLLDQAGWKKEADGWRYKDGQKLAFTWKSYNEAEWSTKIVALAKENWKELGVDLTIELMDFNSLSTFIRKPENKDNFEMWNMAWGLTPDPNMQSVFGKDNFAPANNMGWFYNEKIEELMEKGLLELDQNKRKQIYLELAKEFNEEVPYIFVYVRMNPWLVNKRVKNFSPSEFQYWFHNAHLIEIVTKK